jgi:mannose-1-phosphate guanylyltransferase
MQQRSVWCIVLAGGDGTRLSSLTHDASGTAVPKQYCSLRGGRTLFGVTLQRALAIAPAARIVVSVAAAHAEHWSGEVHDLPPSNVLVQPANRGTAPGLLLPVLSILERDADAQLLVLPSDHHVSSEALLRVSLLLALEHARREPSTVTLVGMPPDAPTSDYGWIVPDRRSAAAARVVRFVEKPPRALAEELLAGGALWNSFLLAGAATAFRGLFRERLPELVERMGTVLGGPRGERGPSLRRLYGELEADDFSRRVLEGSEERLRVLAAAPCGWTDLGTPERVVECLRTDHRGRLGREIGAFGSCAPVLLDAVAPHTHHGGMARAVLHRAGKRAGHSSGRAAV